MVLATMLAGIVLVPLTDSWRLGTRVLAGALVGAAVLRLVLPQKDAGMLAVRHRLLDVVLVGGVGVALFLLASSIPDQPSL